jgi:hypothetical protein
MLRASDLRILFADSTAVLVSVSPHELAQRGTLRELVPIGEISMVEVSKDWFDWRVDLWWSTNHAHFYTGRDKAAAHFLKAELRRTARRRQAEGDPIND